MVTESISIPLPDTIDPDGWKIISAATSPSESQTETLSEKLERITAEKLAAIKSQQDALAAEILAVTKNAVDDVVRVHVIETLNDESKFKLPDDLDLESDLNLSLQFSVATGKFTLSINPNAEMPRSKTVTDSSCGESARDTTLDFLDARVFDDFTDSGNASPALKQGVRLTIMGLEQWLDPDTSPGKKCK